MKHLFTTTVLIFLACVMYAQRVDVHGTHDISNGVYSYESDALALTAWEQHYGADLFAFPVEAYVILTANEEQQFRFRKAARVFLEVAIDLDIVGSRLVVRDASGHVTEERHLRPGTYRILQEIPHSRFTLEWQSPADDVGTVEVVRLFVEPREEQTTRDIGFKTSLPCHENARCPNGQPWADQVRSAVRIMMVLEEGIGWCSGTLVNNTQQDGTPLILSAEHCLAEYTPEFDLWRFDFNYDAPGCVIPEQEPEFDALTGCMLLARQRDTDFMLLELTDDIPVFWNPYFSGWNRTKASEPVRAALIHHPSGDITKLSTDVHKVQIWDKELSWHEGYSTPAYTHYRARFDQGTFENGSSGGALFDTSGLVIGQLHGGTGDCAINTAYCGILAESWDYGQTPESRLRDWLDPLGMDTMVLAGMEHPDKDNVYSLSGAITSPYGEPMRNVQVQVSGGVTMDLETDEQGRFHIDILPRSSVITLQPHKNTYPANGVSVLDLLLIQKHLLGIAPFAHNHQLLASDATANGVVSAADMLILQKLLLGKITVLPGQTSWVFDPPVIELDAPEEDAVEAVFTGIKIGDVNGTAVVE